MPAAEEETSLENGPLMNADKRGSTRNILYYPRSSAFISG
jgi:hypothetical protein